MILRRLVGVLVLVLYTIGAGVARADDVESGVAPLSLDEVIGSVERSFPLLKAAELEQVIASADQLSADGAFDLTWKTRGTLTPVGYYDSVRVETMVEKPTAVWGASAFAGWKLGTGRFASYDGRLQTLEYGELRAGINVPLWRNGPIDRRRASLARAELGNDVARLSVVEQRIGYRRAAAHRYWAWVAAGRQLAIAKDLLNNVSTRDVALGARVERGDLAAIEQVDNARALEQRKAQLAAAQRGVEQAAIELSLFLRDSTGAPVRPLEQRLPRAFPEPAHEQDAPTRADFDLARSRRPEVRRLHLQAGQQRIELDWAENQLAPGLDIQLAGSQDFGRDITLRPDLSKPIFEMTLLIDVPIQTRAMRGRARAASAMIGRLEQQRTFATDRIEADVRDAHSAIRGALQRVDAARREVRLAIDLESAERTRFEQGDSHLLVVNIREQQTAEAELREVAALADYHRAVADMTAARGQY